MNRLVWKVAIALLSVVCSHAFACSCVDLSLEQVVANANEILVVDVVSAEKTVQSGKEIVEYESKVEDVLKGGKKLCHKLIQLHENIRHGCSQPLYVGGKYVVFLQEDRYLRMCAGTNKLDFYLYQHEGVSLMDIRKKANKNGARQESTSCQE